MSEQTVEGKLPDYGTRTDEITIFAGPCSVESEEQFNEVAECIAGLGLHWIRGGARRRGGGPQERAAAHGVLGDSHGLSAHVVSLSPC